MEARGLYREQQLEAAKRWREVALERQASVEAMRKGESPDTPERKAKVARHARDMEPKMKAESAQARSTGVAGWLEANATESIIDTPDFDEPRFLEIGLAIGRAVCLVTVTYSASGQVSKGTAFLVAPGVILTNYHVIRDEREAANAVLSFDYQNDSRGRLLPQTTFSLDPGSLFIADKTLDCALVAVGERLAGEGTIEGFGWMPLVGAEGKVEVGDPVNAIQHPQGRPKQWVIRNNPLILLPQLDSYRDPKIFAHYAADTLKGSSGAPMLSKLWEVFALHHMAVPAIDDRGNILDVDGQPYAGADESRVKWVGNEGVRVSALVRFFSDQRAGPGRARQARLLASVLQASRPDYVGLARQAMERQLRGPAPESTTHFPIPGGAMTGRIEFKLPLKITIELDGAPVLAATAGIAAPPPSAPPPAGAVAVASAPDPLPKPGVPAPLPPALAAERDAALATLEAARTRTKPYYDEAADQAARDEYYGGIDAAQMRPGEAFEALRDLLTSTHATAPAYKPAVHVYPWVELRKEGRRLVIKSIYSGKTYDPAGFIEEAFQLEAKREEMRSTLMKQESFLGAEAIELMLEAQLPYNCEHVVPQSWFAKREPMRGDLHHLFACESNCNSFRGNHAYFDFPDFEALRDYCGKRENNQFEPEAGKGPVARATLYFLLRYPGAIDLGLSKMDMDRVETLKRWHEGDPVGEYERHRNQAIFEVQGNRNPLIDHPGWVEHIDFSPGLEG